MTAVARHAGPAGESARWASDEAGSPTADDR